MAIEKTDLKLLESERLTDNPDGGGAMTGNEVIDGKANNLFPDISRLDRTYGRVSLRKAYLAVLTGNKDTYYGAHCIITEPPSDKNISTTLFTTRSFSDVRSDARNHIENYVVRGARATYRLLGDQLEGQRSITAYQDTDLPLPEIGSVIALTDEEKALEQFTRITDVSAKTRTFVVSGEGEFSKNILTIEISNALRHDFRGMEATKYTDQQPPTVIRNTQVADAASYYGIMEVAEPISGGDLTVKVDSPFGKIVPTTESETSVTDKRPGGDRTAIVPAGDGTEFSVDISNFYAGSDGVTFHFGRAIEPGTVRLPGNGLKDNAAGDVINEDGSEATDWQAVIDYTVGSVQIEHANGHNLSGSAYAQPAAAITGLSKTMSVFIAQENRGFVYNRTIRPIPGPRTLVIDYMTGGDWYRLVEQGDGRILGTQDNVGTGSLDYTTGTVEITLAREPDADSSIIYYWSEGDRTINLPQNADADLEPPAVEHTVGTTPIAPTTLTLEYVAGGTIYTAQDDGGSGFSGDGSGVVDYQSGEIYFEPAYLPDAGSEIAIAYHEDIPHSHTYDDPGMDDAGDVTLSLDWTPVRPGSVKIHWREDFNPGSWIESDIGGYYGGEVELTPQEESYQTEYSRVVNDDGNGNLIDPGSGTVYGTVDYSTGDVALTPTRNYTVTGKFSFTEITNLTQIVTKTDTQSGEFTTSQVSAEWSEDNDPLSEITTTISAPALSFDLTRLTTLPLVPGSLGFKMGGSTYYDQQGTLRRDPDPATGLGTEVGTVDYSAGRITLDSYADGGDPTPALFSGLITQRETVAEVTFRTPGAPVRPGSTSIRGTLPDGTEFIATESGGKFDNPNTIGEFNFDLGIGHVVVGEWYGSIPDDPKPAWYAERLTDTGDNDTATDVFKPIDIDASTLRFNTVVVTTLPLDADQIGLDPIRLPADGSVPIVRAGDVLVVHRTDHETLPAPLSDGQTVALEKTNLAYIELADDAGTEVDSTLYTVSLDAGEIYFADPLDLSGYTEPLVATYRTEDMVLCSEAQITGALSLVEGVSHDYPADGQSYVSSALLFGDMAARYHHFFDEATWDGSWEDYQQGDPATATYNNVNYPVEVTNEGAIEERWALSFTSDTSFEVIGERVGVLGEYTTSEVCDPSNPETGAPYFTVQPEGWGTGWQAGNVVRFNTSSANAPIWLARTTVAGDIDAAQDEFVLQIRGDAE